MNLSESAQIGRSVDENHAAFLEDAAMRTAGGETDLVTIGTAMLLAELRPLARTSLPLKIFSESHRTPGDKSMCSTYSCRNATKS